MPKNDVYKSKAWKNIRYAYALSKNCQCERCGRYVYVDGLSQYIPKEKRLKSIVHHKEYLNATNWTNDDVAYNTDNLELLCIDCHNREHFNLSVRKGMVFDDEGNLVQFTPLMSKN